MSSALLVAQFRSSYLEPPNVFAFIGFTLVFLLMFWLFDRPARLATTMIAWGILLVLLSVAYVMTGIPPVVEVTAILTKIGFMLVLGGIVLCLLLNLPSAASDTRENNDV